MSIQTRCQLPAPFSLFTGILLALLFISFLPGCTRFQTEPIGELSAEPLSEEQITGEQVAEEEAEEKTEEKTIEEADVEYILASLDVPHTEPRFAVIPPNARPGEPVTVGYSDNFTAIHREFQAVLLDSRSRLLTRAIFFDLDTEDEIPIIKVAIMAVPSTALVGSALIHIVSDEDIILEIPFTIDEREFLSETIALDQANTNLRTLPDPRRTAESQQLWAIINRTGNEIFDTGPFEPPVTSTRRTSSYGSRRIYRYVDGRTDTAIHAGVDYGVPTGTEVMASASGRVVLARNRILTGNSVILEHLPGVYSLYYHLDSIAVNEGSIIEAGTFLGASGATGLATGPHLHWEIRVSGENADPDAFLPRSILDKNEILTKMSILY